MVNVTDFKQYLSKKIPEDFSGMVSKKNRVCCAVYNYLRCFREDEEKLTPELFTDFYKMALLFPHWQSCFSTLQKGLKSELDYFHRLYYSAGSRVAEEELLPTQKWQWVAVQNTQELIKMVQVFLQTAGAKKDRIAVLPFEKNRVLALILKFDGSMEVLSFGRMALIHQGKLEPLIPLSKLYYSPEYDLRPGVRQNLEDGILNFFPFKIKEGKVTGFHCRSVCFQPSLHFHRKQITQMNTLFSLLKKTESFFIQPKSDPHYQDLIQALHRHYRRLLTSSPPAPALETKAILARAKEALQNLYPQDHLLFLLTSNIDFHYRKTQAPSTSIPVSPPAPPAPPTPSTSPTSP